MDAMAIVMSVGGLVIGIVVVVSVFLTFSRIFGGLNKANAERDRLLREGIQTSARVLGVQMGNMTMQVGVQRHLQLQVQLEVQMQGRPPYQAMLTTMISELQIPQIQPGAMLTVRVDRMNPNVLALEGVGAPGQGAYPGQQQPQYHQAPPQGGPYGAPYGGGAPAGFNAGVPGPYGPMGMAPQGGMIPIGGAPAIPGGAKLGLWLGIGGAVVGVIVAIVVVLVNVMGVGLGSASERDGVCAQAVRCCEVATAKNPASAANCKNLGKLGVPEQACVQSLQSFREMASMNGKTCK